MARRPFAIAVAAAILAFSLEAQAAESRGLTVKLRESEAAGAAVLEEISLYGASHALVIGIDAYTEGWPRLSNAVRDARQVAASLQSKGFEVILKTDSSSTDLEQSLREFFVVKGADPDARLFVWFAGHGHTEDGEGFLVPADAPRPETGARFKLKALPMRRFGEYVRLAESKHVFTVFDSCFAGTVFDTQRALPPAAITQATTQPVRQFLTSGEAEQTVSDDGMFRDLFLRALAGEETADANGDGDLTASELGLFLSNRVTNLTRSRQTPRYGKLRDRNFDRGDFVFQVSWAGKPAIGTSAGAVPQTSPPVRSDAAFELAFWDSIKGSTNPEDYLAYLESFPDGRFAPLARLRARRSPETIEVEEFEGEFVATSNANVRAGPTTSAEKSGYLPQGTRVKVTGRATDAPWYRIEFEGGKTGYVFKDLFERERPQIAAVDPARTAPVTPTPRTSDPTAAMSEMVGRLQPAVVGILVERAPGGGASAGKSADPSTGSGFLIDSAGRIITNHHVVEGARTVTVGLADGSRHAAEVLGSDPRTDIAVLRIDVTGRELPLLVLEGAPSPRIGEAVFAIGRPFGGGPTITRGFVSALGDSVGGDFFQIDKAIAPGDSGGPLFNMEGALIGIAVSISGQEASASTPAIGFAIPIRMAPPVVAAIGESGKVRRARLGVRIQEVTPEIADSMGFKNPRGALVAETSPGGPAEAAGLRAGDVVLSFAGTEISKFRDLPSLVATAQPGSQVAVRYWRQGARRETTVTLGELDVSQATAAPSSAERQAEASRSSDPFSRFFGGADAGAASARVLGMTVSPVDAEARERFRLSSDVRGIVVAEVEENGIAAGYGIQPGYVIVELDQQAISSPKQMVDLVENSRRGGRSSVLMLLHHQGGSHFVALPLTGG